MRNTNPIENTGMIFSSKEDNFLGSCFIFRYPNVVLTANHVLSERAPRDLHVVFPKSRAARQPFKVLEVHHHPTADLSAVFIETPEERDVTWPVTGTWDDMKYGVNIICYGYPENWSGRSMEPTPRFFKGYIQRFWNHQSNMGYQYVAAELSFPCPGGLSGSSILNSELMGRLYGLVTENFVTSTEVDSISEVHEDGTKFRESYHNFIRYGLALWLPSCSDWIDNIVPKPSDDEMARRARNQQDWNDRRGN